MTSIKKEDPANKKREVWIDVLRAFACICILFIHSPANYAGQGGKFIIAPINYLCMAAGVSVFFMISGALLFSKKQDIIPFYKRRFTRILIPIIIWSIIYIIFDSLYENEPINFLEKFLLIPFYYQTVLLWFIYALVGIYLVTPIISSWLASCKRKDVEIVLMIWGITLLLPFLEAYNSDIHRAVEHNGILNYFYGFIGYALLGYYLKTYINIKIISNRFLLLALLAFCLPLAIFIFKLFPVETLITSQNICSALMSTVVFLFFKGLDYKDTKFLKFILLFAEFSFGIYLCHIIFLKPFKSWIGQYHLNYLIQIPLTTIVNCVVSFGFVWLLSKLPKSKILFG